LFLEVGIGGKGWAQVSGNEGEYGECILYSFMKTKE
jgi:hypothetical protein